MDASTIDESRLDLRMPDELAVASLRDDDGVGPASSPPAVTSTRGARTGAWRDTPSRTSRAMSEPDGDPPAEVRFPACDSPPPARASSVIRRPHLALAAVAH